MGYYILSRDIINIALNHIRKLVENCSNLQEFFFFNAIGGGTGFGFCSRLLDIETSTYSNINRLISQVISSSTVSLRFDGALKVNINDLMMNLVPFPRIHFMLSSYSPIISADKAYHEHFSV